MADRITPGNITAAALIMQFSIAVIICIGAFVVTKTQPPSSIYDDTEEMTTHPWMIIVFALITIGLLVLSDEFSNLWKPLFGSLPFSGIGWSKALLWVVLIDIVWITLMVGMTGGSRISPFTPLYFILPALGIFLRESFSRIALYTGLVAVFFSWNLLHEEESRFRPTFAYWIVSVLSFLLATLVGLFTRPH